MKSLAAVFLGTILLLAVAPGYDIFADKSDKMGKSEFAITVKKVKEAKTIKLADGRIAEKTVHVFYKQDFVPTTSHQKGGKGGGGNGGMGGGNSGNGGMDSGDQCYTVLARSAEWKTVENYIVDPTNNSGLSSDFVKDTFAASLASWNDNSPQPIFGTEVTGVVDGIDTVSIDGKNEIMFGSIDEPGVIAVTVTWGIFGGPPQSRELVEWDAFFDDVDFDWGDTDIESGIMDLQNIATHEFGHAAGLGHPSDTCTDETMYAYASIDETLKRSLNAGDIAGIDNLY